MLPGLSARPTSPFAEMEKTAWKPNGPKLQLGLFSQLLSTAAKGELKHGLSCKGSCSNLIQLVAVTSMGKLSAASL